MAGLFLQNFKSKKRGWKKQKIYMIFLAEQKRVKESIVEPYVY